MKFAAFVLSATLAFAQGSSTGSATTKGSCSPANTGTVNVFTINCGIGEAQGQEMLAILNKILAKELDSSAVMVKLEELSRALANISRGIKLSTFSETPSMVTLNFGGNQINEPMAALQGTGVKVCAALLFDLCPVMYVDGDRFFVDFAFFTENSAIRLRKNNLVGGHPSNMDFNFNDQALEIVDGTGKPIFQLIYEAQAVITIKGRFRAPARDLQEIFIGDDGEAIINGPGDVPKDFKLTAIFKHPQWKYPGELVK